MLPESRKPPAVSNAADTLFVHVGSGRSISDEALNVVATTLSAIPGIKQAAIMTPARISMPTSETPPPLVIEIDFSTPAALSKALANADGRDGLPAFFDELSNLTGGVFTYQPMLRRSALDTDSQPGDEPLCTYLVEYSGEAEDPEAWLDYFESVHALILARLPNVRTVTSFRPAAVPSGLARGRLSHAMQRNKIVFDNIAALDAALMSPVIAEIRADAAKFPPYSPGPTRTPMHTRLVRRASRAP